MSENTGRPTSHKGPTASSSAPQTISDLPSNSHIDAASSDLPGAPPVTKVGRLACRYSLRRARRSSRRAGKHHCSALTCQDNRSGGVGQLIIPSFADVSPNLFAVAPARQISQPNCRATK
jgi:hypothetical protein